MAAMAEEELTLEELSERSGVEQRTLRSWVGKGLLSPPLKAGRGATYPASNANRALAVRALKDVHGLSLAEIRRRFMMAKEQQIEEWALEPGEAAAAPGAARAYIRMIQKRGRADEAPARDSPSEACLDAAPPHARHFRREGRAGDPAILEHLILELERILQTPTPRRSRGAVWTRIAVTPDLELSIRGDLEPRERLLFELLADQLRAFLTGRSKS